MLAQRPDGVEIKRDGASAPLGLRLSPSGTLVGVLCGGTLANVYGNTPDNCYIAE